MTYAEMPTGDEAMGQCGSNEADMEDDAEASPNMPVIQFAATEFFAFEGQKTVQAKVWRLGITTTAVEVRWLTKDVTAKAGQHYVKSNGVVSFQPGEVQKTIEVELIDEESWSNTLLFAILLYRPNCAKLGNNLRKTHVSITNNDYFPTNLSGDLIKSPDGISDTRLIAEYIRMQLQHPQIRCATIKMCLVDLCHNLYVVLRIMLQVFLLDRVLNVGKNGVDEDEEEGDWVSRHRHEGLMIVVAMMVIPFAGLHILDYRKTYWGCNGKSRSLLQSAVIGGFMGFERTAQTQAKASDVFLWTLSFCDRIVSDGYFSFIQLVQAIGQMTVLIAYQYARAKGVLGAMHFVTMMVFPVLLLTFAKCRHRATMSSLQAQAAKQQEFASTVQNVFENFELMESYNCGVAMEERIQGKMMEYNKSCSNSSRVTVNNCKYPQWLNLLAAAGYAFYAGNLILLGTGPSVGIFVTNFAIIQKIGGCWALIYSEFMTMHTTAPALRTLTWFLNLPVNTHHRSKLAQRDYTITEKMSLELVGKQRDAGHVLVDDMPIRVHNLDLHGLSLAHQAGVSGISSSQSQSSLCRCTSKDPIDIKQGVLAVIVGPAGEGKATLLNFMDGALLMPTDKDYGTAFIPIHLRRLNVSEQLLFFQGKLIDNLTIGLQLSNTAQPPRDKIARVLKQLKLPQRVIAFLDSDEVLDWRQIFSRTQLQLLNIARALISNYAVTCIHKAVQAFPHELARSVLQVLKDHVTYRGIGEDPNTAFNRRPRTVLITCETFTEYADIIDEAYHLSKEGFKKLNIEEAAASTSATEFVSSDKRKSWG